MFDLAKLPAPPARFGGCAKCAYLETGTPVICFACAHQGLERPSPVRCSVCELPLKAGENCKNPVCAWPDRQFSRNCSIAMRTGILEKAINRYKYEEKKGWARIFGRVLAGFIEEELETFSQFDLILSSPTHVSGGGEEGARTWDHVRLILQRASEELWMWEWDFDVGDPPRVQKVRATPRMQGKNWRERHEIAVGALRESLVVSEPSQTSGKRILVFDDVFTEGLTLNEVARCLRVQGGAADVCGVTLARQPYRAK